MKKIVTIFSLLTLLTVFSFGGAFKVKFGLYSPNCNSDIWEINFENLYLEKADFKTSFVSLEYEQLIDRNIAVTFEIGEIERDEVASEYRDYTYEDGSPIAQAVYYKIDFYEFGLKFYPVPRRAKVFPFIGLSGGLYHYIYNQYGEFIDFESMTVFDGDFLADQYAFGFAISGGINIKLSRRTYVGIEGKYLSLKGDLGSEFEGFEPIDFSGVMTSFVIGVRF